MKSADDLDRYLANHREIAATGERIKQQDIQCRRAECELAQARERLRAAEQQRAVEEERLRELGREEVVLALEDDEAMKRCRECTELMMRMEMEGKGEAGSEGLDGVGVERRLEMVGQGG